MPARPRPAEPVPGVRRRFALLPLGDVPPLEPFREFAAAFFGLDAVVLPPRPFPLDARYGDRHDSTLILHRLIDLVPDDAAALLGVAAGDIGTPRRGPVFGEAALRHRAGVCSLHRLRAPDPGALLRRALRLVAHEGGHLLALPHCARGPCVMRDVRTLRALDALPLRLCPDDLDRLEAAAGFDRRRRRLRLRAFAAGAGLEGDEIA